MTPGGTMTDSQERRMYLRFAAMIATSTTVMFVLTYTNAFAWEHVRWSEERFYMAVLMGGMPFGAPIVGAVVDAFESAFDDAIKREVRTVVDLFTFNNRFNNTWEGLVPGAAKRRNALGLVGPRTFS